MTEEIARPSRRERPLRVNMFRHLSLVFITGAFLATLFNIWTPLGLVFWNSGGDVFSPPAAQDGLFPYPTPTNRPRPRIGIVAGHWGFDTGAVCPDGLTEVDVNLTVATRVKEILTAEGFDVDLLMEKDDRLSGYRALALVSIHADTCSFIGTEATGYKVAATLATARPDRANRLVACVSSRYQQVTGLPYHAGITDDMTSYHAFDEIHTDTIGAIIETGFMNLDRQVLTQSPDLVAGGIANGILCYIRNEDASLPETP